MPPFIMILARAVIDGGSKKTGRRSNNFKSPLSGHFHEAADNFITRLPENFGSCAELIDKAVAAAGSWQDIGRLSSRIVNGKDICASYRIQEEGIDLNGRRYRALVIHSDAHDRRRRKRIDKAIQKDKVMLDNKAVELSRKKFFCLPTLRRQLRLSRTAFFTKCPLSLRKIQYMAGVGHAKTKLAL